MIAFDYEHTLVIGELHDVQHAFRDFDAVGRADVTFLQAN